MPGRWALLLDDPEALPESRGTGRCGSVVRQLDRWMSIAFTLLGIAASVSAIRPAAPGWVFYLPLPALALMLIGSHNPFALPCLARRDG